MRRGGGIEARSVRNKDRSSERGGE